MRQIDKIIVHCTDTPAGRPVSVEQVRDWHVRGNGWADIGYHYLIGLDGTVSPGRDEQTPGAHCKGHNARSIGVCYVGGRGDNGRPEDTRTPAQKAALLGLLRTLRRKYPQARIYGHRDFSAKACPCFDAKTEYAGL